MLTRLKPSPPPRPWAADKRGRPLFPALASKLEQTGRRLCQEGFKQAREKPWLFLLPIKGVGMFFADMGGTDEVPIWSDPTPLYYWKLDESVAAHEEVLITVVRSHLAARGIAVRTSFHSPY